MESVNTLRISAPPWWPLREGRDGKCEGRNEKCEFLARGSVSSSPIVRIFGKGKRKFIANFGATMLTSLPSLSLSLCLYLSLSLSPKVPHAQYRKPIMGAVCIPPWYSIQNSHEAIFGLPPTYIHMTGLVGKMFWTLMVYMPKTIGNRKRDCAWGCARGINTTWENLQIEKHKSGRRSFRSPNWFVRFDLQIFSGGVYPPSATSRGISFSVSNSFWY